MVAPVRAGHRPPLERDSDPRSGAAGKDRRPFSLSSGMNPSLGWLFVIAWAAVCVVLAVIILALTVFV